MSISCKHCSHSSVVKNGLVRGKQRYKCKSCGYNFILGDARAHPNAAVRRAFAILLYGIGKSSYGFIAKLFGVTPAAVQKWIKKEADLMQDPEISSDIMEIEFDEMWHFIESKKNKKWIIKALDRATGRTVAWVTGGRDATTFRKLYDKVKHLKKCTFYTDDWDAFTKVLPADRHIIGKSGTVSVERDNSNTRHHLGRMTRRTKVVSKSEDYLKDAIKIWRNLIEERNFNRFRDVELSIF